MAEHDILDLSTGVERPTIRINGQAYEMRTPDEFTWHQNQLINKRGRQFQNLVSRMDNEEGLTDQETDKLGNLSADMVDQLVVDLPEDVAEKLRPIHQLKIFEAFTKLSREMQEKNQPEATAATQEPADKNQEAGESAPQSQQCLPESSDSTAGTPSGG